MRFLEIERIVKKDGWKLKAVNGSQPAPRFDRTEVPLCITNMSTLPSQAR
jgi:hypothetical protein